MIYPDDILAVRLNDGDRLITRYTELWFCVYLLSLYLPPLYFWLRAYLLHKPPQPLTLLAKRHHQDSLLIPMVKRCRRVQRQSPKVLLQNVKTVLSPLSPKKRPLAQGIWVLHSGLNNISTGVHLPGTVYIASLLFLCKNFLGWWRSTCPNRLSKLMTPGRHESEGFRASGCYFLPMKLLQ